MRKNTKEVLEAFINGKSCRKCESIHTDGRVVMSYSTVIAVRDPADSKRVLVTEAGAHSVTTTVHCNGLAFGLSSSGFTVSRVGHIMTPPFVLVY
jgi:hypothetical protein